MKFEFSMHQDAWPLRLISWVARFIILGFVFISFYNAAWIQAQTYLLFLIYLEVSSLAARDRESITKDH